MRASRVSWAVVATVLVSLLLSGCTGQRAAPARWDPPTPHPRSKTLPVPDPGFATLPTTKPKSGSWVDLEAIPDRAWELRARLADAALPELHCGLAPEPRSTVFGRSRVNNRGRAAVERYVNCLVQPWRTWARARGLQFPAYIPVYQCAGSRAKVCESPADTEAAACDGFDETCPLGVYLYEPYNDDPDPVNRTWVLLHEVAHIAQFQLMDDDGNPLLGWSFVDDDEDRSARRTEMQAECLATGSLARMHDLDPAQDLARVDESYMVDWETASDAQHWDERGGDLAVSQAFRGYIGACDFGVAADSVVAYEG